MITEELTTRTHFVGLLAHGYLVKCFSLLCQHAHVSMGEVIGLLGGSYDHEDKVLRVRALITFVTDQSILLIRSSLEFHLHSVEGNKIMSTQKSESSLIKTLLHGYCKSVSNTAKSL